MFDKLRNSRPFQSLMRILQFLSSVISLGLFSRRIFWILQTSRRALSSSNGAVEGILAASVLYSILTSIVACFIKKTKSKWLRWLMIVLDVLFIGAFIAVAVLTRPNGGPSGPCHKNNNAFDPLNRINGSRTQCQLPLGTFILAIISTILHLITAVFHEVRDHQKNKKLDKEMSPSS